jgi:hypothetical protein
MRANVGSTEGPTSKYRLVINDLVVFFLQLAMHCVIVVKQRIPSWSAITDVESAPRDMEDEERGERRRIWNLDGSPRDDSAEDDWETGGEEQLRFDMEQKSFRVAAGDYVVARVDIVDHIHRMRAETVAPIDERNSGINIVRRGRSWRLRFSGNLRTS